MMQMSHDDNKAPASPSYEAQSRPYLYENVTLAAIASKKKEITISRTKPDEDVVRRLPPDFIPGPNHVVCARGKGYWSHEGNKRYRQLIAAKAEKYGQASNKQEKTVIVSDIVESITKSKGSFVKKEGTTGWVEVDDYFAREKVGQSLRDCLDNQYRSSTKSKKRRRSDVTEKMNDTINEVIHSNKGVSQRITRLWNDSREKGALASDESVSHLFCKANSDILEAIKKDNALIKRFQNAMDGEEGSPTKAPGKKKKK